jgi:hypothetical protein
METQLLERFGIDYVSPIINFRERDADVSGTFSDGIARAESKLLSIVCQSGNRITAMERIQNDEARTYTIPLYFTVGGKSTGSYIEVSLIAPGRSGLAINIRENFDRM